MHCEIAGLTFVDSRNDWDQIGVSKVKSKSSKVEQKPLCIYKQAFY